MKNKFLKLISILILSLTITFPSSITAQEATNSASDQDTVDKIQELKEKVAEKVSQIKEKETKIFLGTILEKEGLQLTIAAQSGQELITLADDTDIYWINTTNNLLTIKQNDLVIDDYIIAIGTYSLSEKTLNSTIIYGRLKTFLYVGKVDTVDSTESLITLKDQDENTIEITYDKNTEVFSKTSDKISESSISSIGLKNTLIVRGYEKDKELITQRILILD